MLRVSTSRAPTKIWYIFDRLNKKILVLSGNIILLVWEFFRVLQPLTLGIMPNTGQLIGQCWKCGDCRKDFKAVWLPTNVCCRVAAWGTQPAVPTQAPYSRHISNQLRDAATQSVSSLRTENTSKPHRETLKNPDIPVQCLAEPWTRQVNSLAPFSTLGKYTCGYYFSRSTDNKKRKTGIPPSDLVAWRSNIS